MESGFRHGCGADAGHTLKGGHVWNNFLYWICSYFSSIWGLCSVGSPKNLQDSALNILNLITWEKSTPNSFVWFGGWIKKKKLRSNIGQDTFGVAPHKPYSRIGYPCFIINLCQICWNIWVRCPPRWNTKGRSYQEIIHFFPCNNWVYLRVCVWTVWVDCLHSDGQICFPVFADTSSVVYLSPILPEVFTCSSLRHRRQEIRGQKN